MNDVVKMKMNRVSVLAAAMYAILENRCDKKLIISFSLSVELMPTADNDQMIGNTISGCIKTDYSDKYFTVDLSDTGDIKIEIPDKTILYPLDKNAVVYIDVQQPITIDFERRRITHKKVVDLNMKNATWEWHSVKGTALDILGAILGEENY